MGEEYKRWINPKSPGQTCYVTSTCLDFAHLFHRREMRTAMAINLLEICQAQQARLHAFVVMSHHIHLLVKPNEEQTISALVSKIKRRSALMLKPSLNEYELAQLQSQTGLNDHRFWKVGFRGLAVYSEEVFHQKLNYIHNNPVRACLVNEQSDYLWSSQRLYANGLHDDY